VHARVAEIAAAFAADRKQRQARTALDRADFDALADAGLSRTGLPVARGGLWQDVTTSTRAICELFRVLASGDSSVALVAAMHPAVLAFWLATDDVDGPHVEAWRAQREWIFDTVEAGSWWGTITSEPGSGGDVSRSKAAATADGGAWRIDGQKHFGSGAGMSDYMLTTAVPAGDDGPDWFYLPMKDKPFDGSAGLTLIAPWDGFGMRATQSHGFQLKGCAAERVAWPGHLDDLIAAAAPFFGTLFTAVVLGIVETAVDAARAQLAPQAEAGALRAYEQVEWTQAELEAWTIEQVYEGMLRAIESGRPAKGATLRGKTVAAQLAESCLLRLCRVVGGGTFSRNSPFGNWFEDVRALGFLRPPWALASDGLFADSWSPTTG
jgi:alkylation response protein AidB-like acyl-CoA dehydrogenase